MEEKTRERVDGTHDACTLVWMGFAALGLGTWHVATYASLQRAPRSNPAYHALKMSKQEANQVNLN